MKISIQTKELSLVIPIPMAIAGSRLAAKLVEKNSDGDLTAEQYRRIFKELNKELKRFRKRHGPLTLVEVIDGDETVRVTM